MNIIILGNGFDIAHGLPTRYTDFLRYCCAYKNGECDIITEDKEIETEFINIIKENMWLSFFLKNTPDLNDDKTWIDFETEIRSAIISICRRAFDATTKKSLNNLGTNDDLEAVKNGHFGAFVNFDNRVLSYDIVQWYDELRKFTRAFEIYCCLWINEKCGATKRYRLNETLLKPLYPGYTETKTYIVSFNYTRTFNRFYDLSDKNNFINYSYVYPHGEACIDISHESADNRLVVSGLVLGTHSFERDREDGFLPIDFNIFQKHNQQHRYSTLVDFQQLLLQLREISRRGNTENVNIYIIGHSLDKSDHAILRHLFTENKNARITVFYHNESSFQQYINNITEILGESDVAVRVKFYHQNNPLNGLLLPYWNFEDGRTNFDIIDMAFDKLSEILSDYFKSSKIPKELSELPTHILLKSVIVDYINDIKLLNEHTIAVKGTGTIEVETQPCSNINLQHNDGNISYLSFHFTFSINLKTNKPNEKLKDEKYTINNVNFNIDTSSYNENG